MDFSNMMCYFFPFVGTKTNFKGVATELSKKTCTVHHVLLESLRTRPSRTKQYYTGKYFQDAGIGN